MWSTGTAKSTTLQILFFCLLAEIRWSVCMLKSHRSLCVSFSRTGAGLCIYYLFVWSNLDFLHVSKWITLPTQPCLVLYSFCANLLHSLIMWLIVSSLSPLSQHLLFCWVLSILALIWLVLMACFFWVFFFFVFAFVFWDFLFFFSMRNCSFFYLFLLLFNFILKCYFFSILFCFVLTLDKDNTAKI